MDIDKDTLKLIFHAIRTSFKRSSIYEKAMHRFLSKITGPRGGERFDCVLCKKPFSKPEIEMDHHPDPVVPLNKRWHQMTVQEYYDRVFGFDVRSLCKSCHKAHTKQQNKTRK